MIFLIKNEFFVFFEKKTLYDPPRTDVETEKKLKKIFFILKKKIFGAEFHKNFEKFFLNKFIIF